MLSHKLLIFWGCELGIPVIYGTVSQFILTGVWHLQSKAHVIFRLYPKGSWLLSRSWTVRSVYISWWFAHRCGRARPV